MVVSSVLLTFRDTILGIVGLERLPERQSRVKRADSWNQPLQPRRDDHVRNRLRCVCAVTAATTTPHNARGGADFLDELIRHHAMLVDEHFEVREGVCPRGVERVQNEGMHEHALHAFVCGCGWGGGGGGSAAVASGRFGRRERMRRLIGVQVCDWSDVYTHHSMSPSRRWGVNK